MRQARFLLFAGLVIHGMTSAALLSSTSPLIELPLPPKPANCAAGLKGSDVKLVIDPFSSGRFIVEELRRRGFPVLLAQSMPDNQLQFNLVYRPHVIHTGNTSETIEEISEHFPTHVFTGAEPAVELTDQTAHALSLLGNDPRTWMLRRHKGRMQQAMRDRKKRAARSLTTRSAEDAIAWVRTHNAGVFPVVVKPTMASATQGFRICETAEQIRQAFRTWLGRRSRTGVLVDELEVQERLVGLEYSTLTVGRDGIRMPVATFLVHKLETERRDGTRTMIYDYDELMDPEDTKVRIVEEYALEAADALEMRHGVADIESIYTANGPTLVEGAARLPGGSSVLAVEPGVGLNPVKLYVDAFLDGERFLTFVRSRPSRRKLRHVWIVQFIATEDSVVTELPPELPAGSFYDHDLKVGTRVPRTETLGDSRGQAILIHSDLAVMRDWRRQIRDWERRALRPVTPSPSG